MQGGICRGSIWKGLQNPAELRFSPTLKVTWQSGLAVVWQTLLTGPGEAQAEDLGGRRRRPLNRKQASWGGSEKEAEGLVSWMGKRGGQKNRTIEMQTLKRPAGGC